MGRSIMYNRLFYLREPMPKKIIQLDPKTINQIAAGEVVENPASVVKELVENSIDAEAKKIVIEVLDGGFSLIKISDDGVGFNYDDLSICLKRHTTSKLKNIEDLWKIESMGFRGEALASIASISECSISTKAIDLKETDSGYKITNYPEEKITVAAHDYGTTIEVKSLFYNVPARKAFQKSSSQSLSEIIKTVTKICLGFPEIEIKLIASNKLVFHHQGKKEGSFSEELKKAIGETLEQDFLKEAFWIDEKFQELAVRGYLGSFKKTRANRLGQHLFINRRAVISPVISQVIKNAYGTRIDSMSYPTFVLHLDIPCQDVDVNVHPQKKEVRIKEGNLIYEKLKKGVIKTLLGISKEKLEESKIEIDQSNSINSRTSNSSFSDFKNRYSTVHFQETPKWDFEKISLPEVPFNLTSSLDFDQVPVLGRIYDYLIVETENLAFLEIDLIQNITIINTKALKQKIHFESLKKLVQGDLKNHAMQNLLFPVQLELSLEDVSKIEKNLEWFELFGVSMSQMGPRIFTVDALLEGIAEDEVKDWVNILLEEIDHIDEEAQQIKLLKKLTKRMKSSNEKMNQDQLYQALKELIHFEDKMHSPFGEKIFLELSESQMEKLFQ